MPQPRRPIESAPKNGEPFIVWEYSDEKPLIAYWHLQAELFVVNERNKALATKYATWVPLPEVEE